MLFQTKVVTIVGGDKYQYFHYHKSLDDRRSNVNNDGVLEIAVSGAHPGDKEIEYVSYPLCNVERFETKSVKERP
jgi:hypothetical protein